MGITKIASKIRLPAIWVRTIPQAKSPPKVTAITVAQELTHKELVSAFKTGRLLRILRTFTSPSDQKRFVKGQTKANKNNPRRSHLTALPG